MKEYVSFVARTMLVILMVCILTVAAFANSVDQVDISEIERTLELKDPYVVVQTWAEAVKTRNGKLQYALMSPDLRNKYYSTFVDLRWVTGVSSPWVESFEITEIYRLDDRGFKYEVVFTYTDSTKSKYFTTEYVTTSCLDDGWYISAIERVDIKGEITELLLGEDKNLEKFFVQALSDVIGYYDKAYVIIGEETKIYEGFTDKELSVSDLKEGTEVIVVFTDDPIIMIYPISAKAEVIRVI